MAIVSGGFNIRPSVFPNFKEPWQSASIASGNLQADAIADATFINASTIAFAHIKLDGKKPIHKQQNTDEEDLMVFTVAIHAYMENNHASY